MLNINNYTELSSKLLYNILMTIEIKKEKLLESKNKAGSRKHPGHYFSKSIGSYLINKLDNLRK